MSTTTTTTTNNNDNDNTYNVSRDLSREIWRTVD